MDISSFFGGGDPSMGGILSPEQQALASQYGLLSGAQAAGQLAMPTRTPVGLGAVLGQVGGAIGQGRMQGAEAAQGMQRNNLQTQMLQMQLAQRQNQQAALGRLMGGDSGGAPSPLSGQQPGPQQPPGQAPMPGGAPPGILSGQGAPQGQLMQGGSPMSGLPPQMRDVLGAMDPEQGLQTYAGILAKQTETGQWTPETKTLGGVRVEGLKNRLTGDWKPVDSVTLDAAKARDSARATAEFRILTPEEKAFGAYMKANPDATPEQQQAFIQQGKGMRSGATAATQRFLQENPDATSEDVAQFVSGLKAQGSSTSAFATGKQGQAINSFNVGIAHLNTLQGLADALHNGNVQGINKAANAWSSQFGGTAPVSFDAAKSIVGDEIVKAVVGGGGALGDREEAQKTLDSANTPEQLRAVIGTYKDLMAGQLNGLRQQYEQTTHKSDFDERLSPETRAELKSRNIPTPAISGKAPVAGIVENGYRFNGGDPADPKSWTKQ